MLPISLVGAHLAALDHHKRYHQHTMDNLSDIKTNRGNICYWALRAAHTKLELFTAAGCQYRLAAPIGLPAAGGPTGNSARGVAYWRRDRRHRYALQRSAGMTSACAETLGVQLAWRIAVSLYLLFA